MESLPMTKTMGELQDQRSPNNYLELSLRDKSAFEVLGHFCGIPAVGSPQRLNEAVVVCIDAEWWMKEPKPVTELGIAELMETGLTPTAHAENILCGMQVAHARVMQYAHLINHFVGAGDPEKFHFGKTKFVTMEEVTQVLVNTFVRPREFGGGGLDLQPIILVGHAVENEFENLERAFGVDLRSYGTIVKVIDTQIMAQDLGIKAPRGPFIGLKDLLAHFNMVVPNLHTAGNDAAATLVAAVLLTLKQRIYPDATGPPPAIVQGRSMSDVVTSVMEFGMSALAPPWGRQVYCTRCDHDGHFPQYCSAFLTCFICKSSGVRRLFRAKHTHKTTRCLYQFLPMPPRDFGVAER
jgi:hypothetical protein